MKCKKKELIWKRIINRNGNNINLSSATIRNECVELETLNLLEKAQVNTFFKVKEWLNKQENLENLELLADIACQQKKIKFEAVE